MDRKRRPAVECTSRELLPTRNRNHPVTRQGNTSYPALADQPAYPRRDGPSGRAGDNGTRSTRRPYTIGSPSNCWNRAPRNFPELLQEVRVAQTGFVIMDVVVGLVEACFAVGASEVRCGCGSGPRGVAISSVVLTVTEKSCSADMSQGQWSRLPRVRRRRHASRFADQRSPSELPRPRCSAPMHRRHANPHGSRAGRGEGWKWRGSPCSCPENSLKFVRGQARRAVTVPAHD